MRVKLSANFLRTFMTVVAVMSLTPFVLAQIDTGAIVGTVRDPSGAAVPSATMTVTNAATGISQTTTTNGAGEYQFTALVPGTYSVKAAAAGFSTQVNNSVPVDVQSRPAIDFTLQVGEARQVVEVQASTPLLQTQTADVGGVMQEKQIVDLPLNGRRYADLVLLEAGIQKNLTNTNNTAPDRFSSNGNLELQNYFSLDGVDNNSGSTNLQEGSVQAVQPPPDALQEFRVQTRTYSSEFGNSAGAVVNAAIKSGTNQFHGDLWEFLRNNKLDANTFFNNSGGVPRGHFTQNQYGATIGGPVIKNRTFFFGDFQEFSSRKAATTLSTVPTPLMKQGNFTELRTTLTDPKVAGQAGCVSGNIIKASCIDATGQKLLALFPDPNIPSLVSRQGAPGSWTGSPNYQFQYSVPNDTYSWDVRADHTITQKLRLFGRFSDYSVDRQDPPWTSDPIAGNGNFATQYRIRGKSVALGLTQTLSSSLLNELRGGFNRDFAHSDPIGLKLGTSLASQYGLNGIPAGPNDGGIPPINITGLQRLGTAPWRPQVQISQVWQLLDNLSWLKGDHSLKFGYEFRHMSDNFLDIQSLQGQISASGIYSGGGTGISDFLLGDISTANFTTPTVVHNYMIGHNFYAQDTWRVKPKLTVTYGLRYELWSPLLNHQNAVTNFSPANGGSLVTAQPNGSDWNGRSLIHPDKKDFAPRLGFSYQPWSKIVLRGGYGVFYQHTIRIGSESILALNPPFVIDLALSQNAGSTTPVFQLKNGFPANQFTPALVDLTKLQIRAQDPNQTTGYVHQVSFGPEFQLSASTVLDVTYVGNFGRQMNRLRNANQGVITGLDASGKPLDTFPYPNLNNGGQHAFLELATNDGSTDYNALLVSLRRRFSKDFAYGLSYTWSHNLADFVDNLTGGSTPQNAYAYNLERGDSPFDVTHRFVGYGTYSLPIGKGGLVLNNDNLASRLIGGWQLNASVTLETGTPFSLSIPSSLDQSGTGGNHALRPDCIGDPFQGTTTDPSQFVGSTASGRFINPAAFAISAPGHFGSCGPRNLHGPGLENVDLSLFKNFVIREAIRIQFRGEFFNALNHANFTNPNASFNPASLGSFGRVFGTVTDPREIQFALKLYF
jgi:Carboxypeptidase regulatory-like domain